MREGGLNSEQLKNDALNGAFEAARFQEEKPVKQDLEKSGTRIDPETGDIILDEGGNEKFELAKEGSESDATYERSEIDDVLEKEEAELQEKIRKQGEIAKLIAAGKTRKEAEELVG
jgi:hypothetical protein